MEFVRYKIGDILVVMFFIMWRMLIYREYDVDLRGD